MDKCIVCGNHYHNTLEIKHNGKQYLFDCFECAIHQLAPVCQHCSCRIIGSWYRSECGLLLLYSLRSGRRACRKIIL